MGDIGRIKMTIFKSHGNSINLVAIKGYDNEIRVAMALDQKWNNGEVHYIYDASPSVPDEKNALIAFNHMLHWARNLAINVNDEDNKSNYQLEGKLKKVFKTMDKKLGMGMTLTVARADADSDFFIRKIYLTTINPNNGRNAVYGKFDLYTIDINETVMLIDHFMSMVERDEYEHVYEK